MPYRADLEKHREAARRLEREREELDREIALLESLPSARTIESRILGATTEIARETVLELPFDAARAEAIGIAIDEVYGIKSAVERGPRDLRWNVTTIRPLGAKVEIRIEDYGAGRTRVSIRDRYAMARTFMLGLGMCAAMVFAIARELGPWALAAGVVGVGVMMIGYQRENRHFGRVRERQTLAVGEAIEQLLTGVRARVARGDLAEDGEDHVPRAEATR